MNITHLFRRLPMWARVLILIPALAACSTTNGPGSAFEGAPSAPEFARMAPEARAAAAAEVRNSAAATAAWWTEIAEPIYLAGEPVQVGSRSTGYTMQWVRHAGMTYIYPGHVNSPMGMEQSAMMAVATDAHGNMQMRNNNGVQSPVVLLANVATQEGVGRFMARGAFQIAGAASSGAIAAQIHANAACEEDCGGPLVVNQVGAYSNSESTATGTGNATAGGGCPPSGCPSTNFRF